MKMEAFTPRPYEDFDDVEASCSLFPDEPPDDKLADWNLTIKAELACTPPWDPLPLLRSVFRFYSDLGDVQTCVALLLVLGEKSKELVDLGTQRLWFLDYIEMLECYELWNAAAEVIKMCWITSVSNKSNEVTCFRYT
ncbi:unnamed protein product [Gongylonema pulchrum]|uniref:Uncharacterized protein n=1 Tax=Gongylonema pulchrum TaxID=637853 RepID=A0A3P7RI63_9BILA|nr:unnamed protein product [Gongylonema pulchrum]